MAEYNRFVKKPNDSTLLKEIKILEVEKAKDEKIEETIKESVDTTKSN